MRVGKKMAAFIMTVIMVTTVASGCGGKTSDAGKTSKDSAASADQVTLKMTITGSENDEGVYRKRLDLAEKKYPNIKVDLIYIPEDYSTKLQTMLAGGDGPDFVFVQEDVHGYSALKQIIPLDDYVSKAGLDLDKRFGTAYKSYEYRDQLYALPDRGGSMVVYYNKDMFDQAGLEYPSGDWTWADMLNAARKLTVTDGDKVKTYGFAAGDWWPWWMSFIYQNGGRILDENNNVAVDSPETVEALQFYQDLMYKYHVCPTPTEFADMGNIGPDPLFAQGKAGFEITGFWNIGSLAEIKDFKWDIATIWHEKEKGTAGFGSGLAITGASKHKDEAYKIIDFLTDYEGQLPIVTEKEDAPANAALLASDDFLKADFGAENINMEAFKESANIVFKAPYGPWWNEMNETWGNVLDGYMANEKDAASTAKELQAELENVMKQYK